MVNLFEARKNLRMSQKEMGEKLNMGRSTYIKYETGQRDISDNERKFIEDTINELSGKKEKIQENPIYVTDKHSDSKDICTEDLIELKVITETTQHGLHRINKMIEKLIGKK